MNKDDTIYILLLIISIPIGYLFKNVSFAPRHKALLSSLIGFSMVLVVCMGDTLHSIVLVISNSILLVSIHPKYVQYFSFIWSFSYLLFFRMTEYFGIAKPVPYANAVQLILTLKTVGLAFEIHDSYLRKCKLIKLSQQIENEQDNGLNLKEKMSLECVKLEMDYCSLEPRPSLLDMIFYQYCYIGILTGPYFKFRTYRDWLAMKNGKDINAMVFLVKRGRTVPFIILGFLILSKFVSFKDAAMDEFYEKPLWYRLIYMVLIFTLFRFRFYIAWIFAEFSCFTAAFGAYPASSDPKSGRGPTKLDELKKSESDPSKSKVYSFKTIHNIDEYKCETAPTVKEVLHYWNMSVQYWMANNVYKRVSFKPAGQPITMAVSAYWHGLHPGYYLSMLTTTPCIIAENLMEKGFKLRHLNPKYHYYYDWCTWFFRARLFDYMSLGFILLSYDLTIKFWSSVFFVGHFACLFFIILGYLLIKLSKKPKRKD